MGALLLADCTNTHVNGQREYVFICAVSNGSALYYARKTKGHAGIAGTPMEDYQGILIYDHEKTFLQVWDCTSGMPGTYTALSERQHGKRTGADEE